MKSKFNYILSPLETGNPMPIGSGADNYRFSLVGTTLKQIGPIAFHQVGVYHYKMQCETSVLPKGFDNDMQVYTISVFVKLVNNSYTADIMIKGANGEKAESLIFDKYYNPAPSDRKLMVDPPVRKTVSGIPGKNSTFTFMLKANDLGSPMPDGSVNGKKTITITGSGEGEFGTWSYTNEGIYYYTVSEINTEEPDYLYDSTVYTITDDVKDVNGQHVLTRTVTNASNKLVSAYAFINKYKGESIWPNGGDWTWPNGEGGISPNGEGEISPNSEGGISPNGEGEISPNAEGEIRPNGEGGIELNAGEGNNTNIVEGMGPRTGDYLSSMPYIISICISSGVALSCIIYLFILKKRMKEDKNT